MDYVSLLKAAAPKALLKEGHRIKLWVFSEFASETKTREKSCQNEVSFSLAPYTFWWPRLGHSNNHKEVFTMLTVI